MHECGCYLRLFAFRCHRDTTTICTLLVICISTPVRVYINGWIFVTEFSRDINKKYIRANSPLAFCSNLMVCVLSGGDKVLGNLVNHRQDVTESPLTNKAIQTDSAIICSASRLTHDYIR